MLKEPYLSMHCNLFIPISSWMALWWYGSKDQQTMQYTLHHQNIDEVTCKMILLNMQLHPWEPLFMRSRCHLLSLSPKVSTLEGLKDVSRRHPRADWFHERLDIYRSSKENGECVWWKRRTKSKWKRRNQIKMTCIDSLRRERKLLSW